MATASCYSAQIAIILVLFWFAQKCFYEGSMKLGTASAVVALMTVVFWSCRYTVGCAA